MTAKPISEFGPKDWDEWLGSTKKRYAMKCEDIRNVLSRYLDGELSSKEMASVAAHLPECAECQSEYEQQQRLWSVLGRVEPVPAPNLMAAIDSQLSKRHGWRTMAIDLRLRSVGYATAAAALVGLFVWTGAWAGTTRHAADAVEHEQAFSEFLSDVPPGMEIVAVLERIGE